MANTKNKINQGILIDFLSSDLFIKAIISDSGIIHNALISFTVVATCRAFSP